MKNTQNTTVKTAPVVREPVKGQSVFISFNSDGNGKVDRRGALDNFDKIDAVYQGKEKTKSGKFLHRVRLTSGDSVLIEPGSKSAMWQAVA